MNSFPDKKHSSLSVIKLKLIQKEISDETDKERLQILLDKEKELEEIVKEHYPEVYENHLKRVYPANIIQSFNVNNEHKTSCNKALKANNE